MSFGAILAEVDAHFDFDNELAALERFTSAENQYQQQQQQQIHHQQQMQQQQQQQEVVRPSSPPPRTLAAVGYSPLDMAAFDFDNCDADMMDSSFEDLSASFVTTGAADAAADVHDVFSAHAAPQYSPVQQQVVPQQQQQQQPRYRQQYVAPQQYQRMVQQQQQHQTNTTRAYLFNDILRNIDNDGDMGMTDELLAQGSASAAIADAPALAAVDYSAASPSRSATTSPRASPSPPHTRPHSPTLHQQQQLAPAYLNFQNYQYPAAAAAHQAAPAAAHHLAHHPHLPHHHQAAPVRAPRTHSHSSRRHTSQNDKGGVPKRCSACKTPNTPLWREGPEGPKSMCNACGIKWKRNLKRKREAEDEAAAAAAVVAHAAVLAQAQAAAAQ